MSSAQSPAISGPADRAPVELPHPVRMRVLGAVMIGVFLAALDQTVVGTALPTIITDLGGNDLYTWAFTAYLLTSTISGPLYGKLSDLFGRRPIFLFGIGVFMLGSLLAGLSQEMWQLVAARGVQGLGAGALFPIALAVIGDLFAPSERGRYQGLFGAVFGVSILVGPAVGGLLTDTIGWPFVFFFNLPVGALVFYLVWRYLPLYHLAGDRPKIDYVGAALFTGALVPILVGLTNKQTAAWSDPAVGGLIALGALILVAFVFVESRVTEPIVPLDLFRERSFTISVSAVFLAAFGFFATVVFLPRWFQVVNGSSATESGYQMLPLLGGLIISAVASGQIVSRTGRYRLLIFGALVVMAAGLFMLSRLEATTPIPILWAWMFVAGSGCRSDVRRLHLDRPEPRFRRTVGDRDEQPDVLPAGRRHGRPRHHGHHLRDDGRGGAAAPADGSGRAARGRWEPGRRRGPRCPDRGRRSRRGDPGRHPGGGQGADRATGAGHRRRDLRRVLDRHRRDVRRRHRRGPDRGCPGVVPARGAGTGNRTGGRREPRVVSLRTDAVGVLMPGERTAARHRSSRRITLGCAQAGSANRST